MEEVCVLEEITENRTEFTKEFMLSNGLHMAAVYPTAVHYQENGQWQVKKAVMSRSARVLMEGWVRIPEDSLK